MWSDISFVDLSMWIRITSPTVSSCAWSSFLYRCISAGARIYESGTITSLFDTIFHVLGEKNPESVQYAERNVQFCEKSPNATICDSRQYSGKVARSSE